MGSVGLWLKPFKGFLSCPLRGPSCCPKGRRRHHFPGNRGSFFIIPSIVSIRQVFTSFAKKQCIDNQIVLFWHCSGILAVCVQRTDALVQSSSRTIFELLTRCPTLKYYRWTPWRPTKTWISSSQCQRTGIQVINCFQCPRYFGKIS